MTYIALMEAVPQGHCMPIPTGCPEPFCQIMLDC